LEVDDFCIFSFDPVTQAWLKKVVQLSPNLTHPST